MVKVAKLHLRIAKGPNIDHRLVALGSVRFSNSESPSWQLTNPSNSKVGSPGGRTHCEQTSSDSEKRMMFEIDL
jgi:hypothetical protein